ncbi:uncharacterized protein LOC131688326 [Topomyia yanbarensis]|uniref:uncharacterized protein LOC131688326 n=1 Tax=Topomyia yanbarensis TaxID=2498891 RepID=UPI00273B339D|nr:uncharacterized protein LOC131688326 [Topomyia yanbarensis]
MSGTKKSQKKATTAELLQGIQQQSTRRMLSDPEVRHACSQTETEETVAAHESLENKLNKCLLLLAHLNTKFDAFASMQCQPVKTSPSVTLSKINLQPVNSYADLERLEENCRDENFLKTTVESIGRIHGHHRFPGQGTTVCLQIIDYFFTRSFLLKCSWPGTGRASGKHDPKKHKIPFMKFDRTIDLFYQTVLYSDATYTKTDCNSFLHRCLKNAKQRFEEVAGIRKPVSRKRRRIIPGDRLSTEEHENDSNTNEIIDEKLTEEAAENTSCTTNWTIEYLEMNEDIPRDD